MAETFVPLVVAFPNADVPVLQVSLRTDYDPRAHLAPKRDDGVLIVGSGLSYHNLRQFGPSAATPARLFDDWLNTTLTNNVPEERARQLKNWEHAPAARAYHPQ